MNTLEATERNQSIQPCRRRDARTTDMGIIALFYVAALILLIGEIFIPSHGILTIFGLCFLIVAIVKTFAYGETAGAIAIITSAVGLPVLAGVAVKVWPHTRIGKLIAPPNPVHTAEQYGTGVEHLTAIVGTRGRARSPLRPAGICEFDGNRYQCVSESGLIESGVVVQAVGIRGRSLEVAPVQDDLKA
jgi:membrane-bound serine protease (ClpP class)